MPPKEDSKDNMAGLNVSSSHIPANVNTEVPTDGPRIGLGLQIKQILTPHSLQWFANASPGQFLPASVSQWPPHRVLPTPGTTATSVTHSPA